LGFMYYGHSACYINIQCSEEAPFSWYKFQLLLVYYIEIAGSNLHSTHSISCTFKSAHFIIKVK
jgi:hypothetical protein